MWKTLLLAMMVIGTFQECSVQGCSACVDGDDATCETCLADHTKFDGMCCPAGQYPTAEGECDTCQNIIPGCSVCGYDDATTCQECSIAQGYVISGEICCDSTNSFPDGSGSCGECHEKCNFCTSDGTCHYEENFGLKTIPQKTDFTSKNDPTRTITHIKLYDGFLAAISQYSGSYIYGENQGNTDYDSPTTLNQKSLFLSSLDMVPTLNLLVQGSYDKNVYVYQGNTFSNQFATGSQVLHVDLNSDGDLLLGHMNGQLSRYTFAVGQHSFGSPQTVSVSGGRVYGVKMCEDQSFLALVEIQGEFKFKAYAPNLEESFTYDLTEFIDVKLAATDDCVTVAISNNFQMTVHIFKRARTYGDYYLLQTIEQEDDDKHPLGGVSINNDGDLVVVARHTTASSFVYQYSKCTHEFEKVLELNTGEDHEVTAISDSKIAVGELSGLIKVYSYSTTAAECDQFGKKSYMVYNSHDPLSPFSRSVTGMDISSNLLIAKSQYSGCKLFSQPAVQQPFVQLKDYTGTGYQFVSDVAVEASTSFILLGFHDNKALLFQDTGSGYPGINDDTKVQIDTTSQVLHVDINANKVLLGMMNGNLAQYNLDGSADGDSITHSGGRIYGVSLCEGNHKVALVETVGAFALKVYDDAGAAVTVANDGALDEIIEASLAVSAECDIIAVGGISTSQITVFEKSGDQYTIFKTIDAQQPIFEVSIQGDGDIIVASAVTSQQSFVFKYMYCTDAYQLDHTIESQGYDESTAISGSVIVQGNEDGSILITDYQWLFDPDCLPETISTHSTSPRQKLSHDGFSKKLLTSPSMQTPEGGEIGAGKAILFALASCGVLAGLVALAYWLTKSKKEYIIDMPQDSAKDLE